MKEQELITGIDLGSSRIAVTIGSYQDGGVDIKGFGMKESAGMRGGVIVDLKSAAECIGEAVHEAEKSAGAEVESAFIGISGQHIHSSNGEAKLDMPPGQDEVEVKHLKEVISKAKDKPPSLGMETLHVLPSEFMLDGVGGIKDPLGLFCKELKAKVTSITALTTAVQNTVRCVNLAGLDVEQIILNMIATGEVILYPEEKDLGVCLVDIGSHLTDIAVYKGEYPVYVSALPYGGENLSRDIATHFHISLKEAEEIKKSRGVCLRYLLEDNADIYKGKALKTSGANSKKMSSLELAELLEEKCKMLISNIEKRMEPFLPHLGSGIVIAGGTSCLVGIKEVLEEKTALPVRIGKMKESVISSMPEDKKDNFAYATSVGLVVYGRNLRDRENNFPWEKESLYDRTVGKIVNLIKNFF